MNKVIKKPSKFPSIILKSCPFCGEDGRVNTVIDNSKNKINFIIACTRCGAKTRAIDKTQKAMELWDKRIHE